MFRLDAFLDGAARDARCLHAGAVGNERLEVREVDGLRWFAVGGQFPQSMMRLAVPAEIVLPNQLAMLSALTWCNEPAHVLDLGAGSGAFERFFSAHLPACAVTAVESSAELIDVARTWFAWPRHVEVHHADAASWLEKEPSGPPFDLVLCDIFDGEYHPDCLFDPWFYRACEQRLARTGAFALNVSPAADDELVDILAALRQAFAWTVLVPVTDHGNVVVLAGARRPPGERRRRQLARTLAGTLAIQPAQLLPAWERLPSRRQVLGGR